MIFDVQRFSTHDGPGIRTVVFLKGCPLSCAWCENPEGQSPKRELLYKKSDCIGCGSCLMADKGGAIRADRDGGIIVDRGLEPSASLENICPALALRVAGRDAGIPEILDEVLKDRSFFARSEGGLTLSGGEPLLQIELALGLFKAALDEGLDIAIETCLAVGRPSVERAATLPLHWLADLKHTDEIAYRAGTGGEVALALGNIAYLAERGVDMTLRVPVVPGFNDDEASMRGILEFAASLPKPSEGKRRVELLPYHDLAAGKYASLGRGYAFAPGPRVGDERMRNYAEEGRSLGLEASIGG
jgi:glycyl-radical enzyme activating protein family